MTSHSRTVSLSSSDTATRAANGPHVSPSFAGDGTPEAAPAIETFARRARLRLVGAATPRQAADPAPTPPPALSRGRTPRVPHPAVRERWSARLIGMVLLSIVAPWIGAFAVRHTLNGGTGLLLAVAALASGISVLVARDARSTRAHRRLEHEYSQFFALSPDPLCVLTLDGTLARVNPAWGAVLGVERAALLGTSWFEFAHPQDAPALHLAWSRLLGSGETVNIEIRSRAADGDELWLQWNLALSRAQGVVLAAARDVTSRRRQEQQLRELTDAAVASSRELESFSYSVSHDLRRPLRAIEGFGAALADEYAAHLDETGLDYLARIRRNNRQASELIDDLLTLAQLARCEPRDEAVDLTALAGEILDDLREGDPDHRVETDVAPGLTARGDLRLLRIVLDNLLGNAWKFSRQRAPARITVAQVETVRGLAYCVRDNGAGFDMAYADKLFGAFQRLHRADQFEGTGVGLATVQRVILRHGGDVWAEGAVGAGASVYFRLPECRATG